MNSSPTKLYMMLAEPEGSAKRNTDHNANEAEIIEAAKKANAWMFIRLIGATNKTRIFADLEKFHFLKSD